VNVVQKTALVRQLMGAAQVFSTAVEDFLERTLRESTGEMLSMSQVELLLLIARPGQRYKVSDVADFLGVTNAAASRSIDRLVQRGLVERSISVEDRRAVDLALNPDSEALLERFAEVRDAELLRLLGHVPTDKLERVTALLDELSVVLLDVQRAGGERCLRCGVHFRDGCVVRDLLGRECAVSSQLFGDAPEAPPAAPTDEAPEPPKRG
jgi:DNA-binding MarR family transcriptional regulator